MNAELVKSRDDALVLIDAELITFRDFIVLSDHKGWKPWRSHSGGAVSRSGPVVTSGA